MQDCNWPFLALNWQLRYGSSAPKRTGAETTYSYPHSLGTSVFWGNHATSISILHDKNGKCWAVNVKHRGQIQTGTRTGKGISNEKGNPEFKYRKKRKQKGKKTVMVTTLSQNLTYFIRHFNTKNTALLTDCDSRWTVFVAGAIDSSKGINSSFHGHFLVSIKNKEVYSIHHPFNLNTGVAGLFSL